MKIIDAWLRSAAAHPGGFGILDFALVSALVLILVLLVLGWGYPMNTPTGSRRRRRQ